MIKNIVFDIGDVLLAFKPEAYLKELFPGSQKCRRLYENIFLSDLWVELDRGTVSPEEASDEFSTRYPDLKEDIDRVLAGWESILTPMEDSVAILRELKAAGYPLYALSNFPLVAFETVYRRYDFFGLFDGLVISARIKHVKPEPEIYRYLLEKHNLKAQETLFIDDRPINLAPAVDMGFKTIHFTGSLQLRQALVGMNILL